MSWTTWKPRGKQRCKQVSIQLSNTCLRGITSNEQKPAPEWLNPEHGLLSVMRFVSLCKAHCAATNMDVARKHGRVLR